MSSLQQRYTLLLPLILQKLQKITNIDQLKGSQYRETIKLVSIDKKPVLCLSDMNHSIQAHRFQKDQDPPHPFNKYKSQFYCLIDNAWICLNAKNQYLGEPSQYPHPYQPFFHFRKNYQEYLNEKKVMNYKVQCEVIKIRKWGLRPVNIANTGYYGIVIELFQMEKTGQKLIHNIANISSVIYQPVLKQKMQAYRLFDLRRLNARADDKKVPWSVFYYSRDNQMAVENKKKVNILTVDKDQKMLKYNPKEPYSYVNFGEMQGISSFQFPIQVPEINKNRMQMLNRQSIQILFNAMNLQKRQRQERNLGEQLWSSDEQISQENQIQRQRQRKKQKQRQRQRQQRQEDEDDIQVISSDSESQDPLKELYRKQFKNMKIF